MTGPHAIVIENATEGNLQGITLETPKEKLVVFTGLSGSGKSTLLTDVLFNECQRQYLEAMGMEGIRKPRVNRVTGASPAILVSQESANRNPRSSVGTATDAYTDLRMVFEKLHVRTCPACGQAVCSANCREETERRGDDFLVYQYCNHCGHRMDKLTRTNFSFNTKEGACPACEGMGEVRAVNLKRALDERLSLEDGAVAGWTHRYRDYQIGVFHQALRHYGLAVPSGVPVAEYNALQREILLNGTSSALLARKAPDVQPPKTTAAGRFEGLVPQLYRKLAEREGDASGLGDCFAAAPCPACHGERLGELARTATVQDTRLPQLAAMTLHRVRAWTAQLIASLPADHLAAAEDYARDLDTKLARLENVGLGYLTLNRSTVTLSGGELQRMRLAGTLDSKLSGIIYLLDEPTAGLHPQDTAGMVRVLENLRDLGNTVLVIEHDPDVIRAADYVVELGPGAGKHGGRVVAAGTLEQLSANPRFATGAWLQSVGAAKTSFRPAQTAAVHVRNARLFNLQGLNADVPKHCLTAVTGPSGSGKSTLVFELIAKGDCNAAENAVTGTSAFDRVVEAGQSPIVRMKRSNVATYLDAYTDIRKAFAQTDKAKASGLSAKSFSFNTPGGRCERCEGMGTVTENMLFFLDMETTCPACHGRRFSPDVLQATYRGLAIDEVLKLSVEDAAAFFGDLPRLARTLGLLLDVGLGYLELGQTLSTLSGGEAQRLKLARELVGAKTRNTLYLLDEPTRGLHPQDVDHFLTLIDRLVDEGGTAVVVEHNRQVIERSDWVIDLGPAGGDDGGRIVFAGTPAQLRDANTATAHYLR